MRSANFQQVSFDAESVLAHRNLPKPGRFLCRFSSILYRRQKESIDLNRPSVRFLAGLLGALSALLLMLAACGQAPTHAQIGQPIVADNVALTVLGMERMIAVAEQPRGGRNGVSCGRTDPRNDDHC
jgi:hypothetical protein